MGRDPGQSEATSRTINRSIGTTQRQDHVTVQLTLTFYAPFCFKSRILNQKYSPSAEKEAAGQLDRRKLQLSR